MNKKLPEQTVINLNKIADFLESNVKDEQFNIKEWREGDYRSKHDCGTTGCAIGWAPFIEGLEPLECEFTPDWGGHSYSLDFRLYWRRILEGVDSDTFDNVFGADNAFNPLSETREHTIKRIRALANGEEI